MPRVGGGVDDLRMACRTRRPRDQGQMWPEPERMFSGQQLHSPAK